jgi:hypothetical protein
MKKRLLKSACSFWLSALWLVTLLLLITPTMWVLWPHRCIKEMSDAFMRKPVHAYVFCYSLTVFIIVLVYHAFIK